MHYLHDVHRPTELGKVVASARITGRQGILSTAVVDPHVMHGVEVSAPLCRPPLFFS